MPIKLLCLAILAAACAVAQTVAGTVVNSATGDGIAGVEVEIDQADKTVFTITTDAHGHFRIEGVPIGAYEALYSLPGYWLAAPDGRIAGSQPFQVTAAGDPVKLEARLHLIQLGRISGRVVDTRGKAVAGAQLELTSPGLQIYKADAEGKFELEEIPSGSYSLAVVPPYDWKPPEPEPGSGRVLGWTRTYYPGVALPEAASPIVVAPGGDVSNIELKLLAVPTHAVHGMLLNPDGTPAANVAITLGEASQMPPVLWQPPYRAESGRDGAFEFPALVDGEWRFTADVERAGVRLRVTQWMQMAGRELEGVKLRLSAPFTVRGKVVMETPQGMAAPTPPSVALEPRANRIRTESFPVTWGPRPEAWLSAPDAGGSFTVENVYPGEYRIAATDPPPGYYLDSVRVGEAEPSTPQVEISGPVSLTMVYKTNGGSVRGAVENCASGSVLLIPQDPAMRRPGFFRRAVCGSSNRYEIPAVRPGDYYALGLAGGGGTPLPVVTRAMAGKFDDGLLRQAATVTVRAGETTAADLSAITRLAY